MDVGRRLMPQVCGPEHDVFIWVVVHLMRRAVGGRGCGIGRIGIVPGGLRDRRIMVWCRVAWTVMERRVVLVMSSVEKVRRWISIG